jgi:hypothetical protein
MRIRVPPPSADAPPHHLAHGALMTLALRALRRGRTWISPD